MKIDIIAVDRVHLTRFNCTVQMHTKPIAKKHVMRAWFTWLFICVCCWLFCIFSAVCNQRTDNHSHVYLRGFMMARCRSTAIAVSVNTDTFTLTI